MIYNFKFLLENFVVYYIRKTWLPRRQVEGPSCSYVRKAPHVCWSRKAHHWHQLGGETKILSERVPLRQCNTLTLPLPTLDVAFETQRLASHSQSTLHELGLVPHSLHVVAECPPQLTSAPRNNSYWSKQVSVIEMWSSSDFIHLCWVFTHLESHLQVTFKMWVNCLATGRCLWLEGRVDERNKECASSEDIVALVEKLYLMSLIFWYKCFIFEKKK